MLPDNSGRLDYARPSRAIGTADGSGVIAMFSLPADDIERLNLRIEQLKAALKLTEFGFNHARCPVCAGWNCGPYGETDHAHTPDCPIALALAYVD